MHDDIKLSYLGLSDREISVLKSIFTLAPELSENYLLTSPDELDEADVILIDADDPRSLQRWEIIRKKNDLATSIMLTDSEAGNQGDVVLQRPIRVQKLIAALDGIVKETTQYKAPNPGVKADINVLIVDDSFPVRKYMEKKLTSLIAEPLNLSFAASGEEAFAKVVKSNFDIIFLDVMMGGVDGYKVCKAIKAKLTAYIVMLTSKKSPFDKVRGTMSGCDAFVTKPPTDQNLIDQIEKSVNRRVKTAANSAFKGTG